MVEQKKFNTKVPIIFNEYEYGKYLDENSCNEILRPKVYTIKELTVLGKYYRTLKDDRNEVKNKLIQFCNVNYIGFDADVKYAELNMAVNGAFETKIRTSNGVPITKNEWEKIQLIEDERGQKILFVMLAVSKFNRLNPVIKEEDEEEIIFKDHRLRCYLQDKDIFKLAKIGFRNREDYYKLYGEFGKHKLMDLIPANTSKVILNFGDLENEEKDILIIIKDMDNLMEVFKALKSPKNMKQCKKCDNWFEDKSPNKRLLLCTNCRKIKNNTDKIEENRENNKTLYRKEQVLEGQIEIIKCIDCGNIIGKNVTDKRKIRCEVCQKKYNYQRKLKPKKIIECMNCGVKFEATAQCQRILCKKCYKKERNKKKAETMRMKRALNNK